MSKETKPRKPRSSTKKSKSELEAKIAELEAKLNQLSSQVRPGEARAPPPAPKTKEAPKPSTSSVSSGEVAPAYANVSSTRYTGNRYYATRARLAYHPPDKQFKGESTVTTQTSRPSPAPELQYTYEEPASRSQEKPKSSTWKAKGAQAAEEYHVERARPSEAKEESRPTPPPAPKPKEAPKPTISEKVKKVSSTGEKAAGEVAPAYATISSTGYTGNRYYATRARLSYHPPDKQYKGEAQSTVQVAPEPPKPKAKRGTLPAGWKP